MPIHIQTALSSASNFLELAPIVMNAKEDISFFGGRYIYSEGYEGSLDIDAIAARCMALKETHSEPNEKERNMGRQITHLANILYEKNYSRHGNILTRIFCAFRDFLRNVYIFFSGQALGIRDKWNLNDTMIAYFDPIDTQKLRP